MRKLILLSAFLSMGSILFAQTFKVNTNTSKVEWLGKKIGKEHYGTVGLKEGKFEIKDNKFISGTFIIDMDVMTDESHPDPNSPGRLINHLKSDDFFDVEKFPEAKLQISESEAFEKGEAKVTAKLTIKGITHPIEFVVLRKGANFSSSMVFDRSKYDVKFGSNKFQELGDKAIKDEVWITVNLIAERQR